MSRLIDADELKATIKAVCCHSEDESDLLDAVEQIPSVDAVEVVRCKNCCYWDRETVRQNSNDFKWWNEAVCKQHSIDGNEPHEMWTDADWFCADGERRDDA